EGAATAARRRAPPHRRAPKPEPRNGKVVPIAERRAAGEPTARILDAAEALFMEHGYEATTLRAITAAAGANLAAVNYRFGSKEELFQSVLTRLEAQAAPSPLSCERILIALLRPALELARDRQRGGKDFLRLLGRAYA